MDRTPPFPGFPDHARRGSHFHALARAIIYQQLAGNAAAAIYGRVRALTPGTRFPDPEECLTLTDLAFRTAGLSRNKTRALKDLAQRVTSGEVRLRSIGRASDEEVIAQLTRVWGIGEWSAQIFLMFRLGRLDVMPATDLGIREGLKRLDRLDGRPEPHLVLERAEAWRPLRSVAAWVLWRLLDPED
jgi:3-methyladenine DNA glycosylase/8-oxoguanine DNA glycosylase